MTPPLDTQKECVNVMFFNDYEAISKNDLAARGKQPDKINLSDEMSKKKYASSKERIYISTEIQRVMLSYCANFKDMSNRQRQFILSKYEKTTVSISRQMRNKASLLRTRYCGDDEIQAGLSIFRQGCIQLNLSKIHQVDQNGPIEKAVNAINELILAISEVEACRLHKRLQRDGISGFDIKVFLSLDACIKTFIGQGIIIAYQQHYVERDIQASIEKILPKHPKDEYIRARTMKRTFVIHVGYTNTGKTYHSIEAMKKCGKGMYLAPLRLLALEIQDKLNSEGYPCSLITGEEEDVLKGANYMSSTVEKGDFLTEYDLCVIDECQLLGNSQRGGAWSKAILGVLAKEIHLCTAPEGLPILERMIMDLGETYDIQHHLRDTELLLDKEVYHFPKDVEDGDALIVFSKRAVLSVAAALAEIGFCPSIVYGSLPYNVRKKQFQRFLNKESNILVSTDAIGMGVNLPIKRIVFMEIEKFDGVERRNLKTTEIKQIAGRAGRRGIYNTGYVRSTSKIKLIRKALMSEDKIINQAYLRFSDILLEIDYNIMDALKVWHQIEPVDCYTKGDVDREIDLLSYMKAQGIELDKRDSLQAATIPFDEKNRYLLSQWVGYIKEYQRRDNNFHTPQLERGDLAGYEDYYKALDLYYSCCKVFGQSVNLIWLRDERERVSNKINNMLIHEISAHIKKCRICHMKMEWNYPFGLCYTCYNNGYDILY